MKKFLTALMAMVMVVSMVGCDKKEQLPSSSAEGSESSQQSMTNEERFNAVWESVSGANAFSGDMTSLVVMKMGEEEVEIPVDMSMAMNKTDDKFECAIKSSTSFNGQNAVMESYYKDGYFYVSAAEQKIKMPMAVQDVTGEVSKGVISNSLGVKFDVADFEKFEMTEANGEYTFTYEVKADAIEKYSQQSLGSMSNLSGMMGEMKITSMSGTVVCDENNKIKVQTLDIAIEATAQGQTVSVQMLSNYNYKEIGDKVEVKFPDDLDSYTEVDSSALIQ